MAAPASLSVTNGGRDSSGTSGQAARGMLSYALCPGRAGHAQSASGGERGRERGLWPPSQPRDQLAS